MRWVRSYAFGDVAAVGVFALSMAWLMMAPPLAAQEGTDLVDDVVSMLEAGVSEQVVMDWLPTSGKSLGRLEAEDVIALKDAGASDELLKSLLRLAAEDVQSVSAPEAAPAATTATPSVPDAAPGRGEAALVRFEIGYSARFEHPDPKWDLFVYLDGKPLTYAANSNLLDPGKLSFTRELPPGPHWIRVAQERHEKRGDHWEHQSRIAPEAFAFELAPGTPASISVDFTQRMMNYRDPLTFVLTQGAEVTDSGRVGGDFEHWAPICEDVLASARPGKKPGRAQRSRLDECVEWSSIWPEIRVPSREEVLDAMAEFGFRPVPKGS